MEASFSRSACCEHQCLLERQPRAVEALKEDNRVESDVVAIGSLSVVRRNADYRGCRLGTDVGT